VPSIVPQRGGVGFHCTKYPSIAVTLRVATSEDTVLGRR